MASRASVYSYAPLKGSEQSRAHGCKHVCTPLAQQASLLLEGLRISKQVSEGRMTKAGRGRQDAEGRAEYRRHGSQAMRSNEQRCLYATQTNTSMAQQSHSCILLHHLTESSNKTMQRKAGHHATLRYTIAHPAASIG